MGNKVSLENDINYTISTMRQSHDFSDTKTVASFMVLLDSIIESPREVLKLENPFRLSIVLTSLITSGFTSNYPRYYNYDTGKIACAVAFYCFMKQIKYSEIPAHNLPAIIVLLHDGKQYIADIIAEALLDGININPYSPLDVYDFNSINTQKYAIVKGIEYIMHLSYNDAGLSDTIIDSWRIDIESELREIKRLIGDDFFKYAIKVYNYLEKKLKSPSPFDFDD